MQIQIFTPPPLFFHKRPTGCQRFQGFPGCYVLLHAAQSESDTTWWPVCLSNTATPQNDSTLAESRDSLIKANIIVFSFSSPKWIFIHPLHPPILPPPRETILCAENISFGKYKRTVILENLFSEQKRRRGDLINEGNSL